MHHNTGGTTSLVHHNNRGTTSLVHHNNGGTTSLVHHNTGGTISLDGGEKVCHFLTTPQIIFKQSWN